MRTIVKITGDLDARKERESLLRRLVVWNNGFIRTENRGQTIVAECRVARSLINKVRNLEVRDVLC